MYLRGKIYLKHLRLLYWTYRAYIHTGSGRIESWKVVVINYFEKSNT
jgi:hypothetical protein